MPTPSLLSPTDVGETQFSAWLEQAAGRKRERGRRQRAVEDGLRFAFYGRTSTGRFQDPATSQQWQWDVAAQAIAGVGRITVEFFDVGCSRTLPWRHRPQAAALLDAAARADRGFDAVVIGEFERAFDQRQARQVIAELHAYGVHVWLPEADGPVDLTDPAHQALLMLLGHQSQREVLRARRRTTAAMRAQARTQGRHLGGRPPYGYRLVDAGPHPNVQHAAWGRKLRRLDPDPDTAPHVRWIFTQRLAGHSTAGIARTLNALGVPPPSAHDPGRNPHRSGAAWTLRTIAAILANPRYTGRQVWNRQSIDHHETRSGDKSSRPPGRKPTHHWNPRDQWVISNQVVHPPLVSDAVFARVQQVSALPVAEDGNADRYQLTGLVICGLCGRRAEGHWAHGRARYRCRHGYTSSSDAQPGHLKTLYVRQDQILAQAGAQLANLAGVDPASLTATELATQLRSREITIVCTPVSITLDTGTDTTNTTVAADNTDVAPPTHPAPDDATRSADGTQLAVFVVAPAPPSTLPRQRRTPTEVIPNVNDFGGG